MLAKRVDAVREAEGAETTPSFGNPSNVRRGKGSAEQPPYIPPNRRERREGRFTPTRAKQGASLNYVSKKNLIILFIE